MTTDERLTQIERVMLAQAERLTRLEGRSNESMIDKQSIPDAVATLERDGDCYLWVVSQCPICGEKHTHGGGELDGDPRSHLSHRVAHCVGIEPPGGYILVEAGE